MKIGIWNIDCPSFNSLKFKSIKSFIEHQDCDLLILTEVNSALELEDYFSIFCDESPYLNKNRCYDLPNKYHQVGIYSKFELTKLQSDEPINGLLCQFKYENTLLKVYGTVFTIKDRWSDWSNLKYSDRVTEQINEISKITDELFIVGGDFNTKFGTNYNKVGYGHVLDLVDAKKIEWPLKFEEKTVQQLLHSSEFKSDYQIIDIDKTLSDHPFIIANISKK